MFYLSNLKDGELYTKQQLLECLKLANDKVDKRIPYSYKAILRRERSGVNVYTNVTITKGKEMRVYRKDQIESIVNYEIENLK